MAKDRRGPRSTKKEHRELENARASKYKLYVYGYQNSQARPPQEASRRVEVGEEAFGPWMMVPRITGRRARQNNSQGQNPKPVINEKTRNGTRFEVIRDLEGKQKQLETTLNQMEEEPIQKESGGKKIAKTPYEKARDHVVVTSPAVNIKKANQQVQKSPLKPFESSQKSSKANTDSSKPKPRKMADFDETLALMKAAEKNLGDPAKLLDDLGATQNLKKDWSRDPDLYWNTTFGTSCWLIWKQRNQGVFYNCKDNATNLLPRIKTQVRSLTNPQLQKQNKSWLTESLRKNNGKSINRNSSETVVEERSTKMFHLRRVGDSLFSKILNSIDSVGSSTINHRGMKERSQNPEDVISPSLPLKPKVLALDQEFLVFLIKFVLKNYQVKSGV
ncbi:uncharacterized protein G2W53_029266 [Senna tora]|uniref:Uncharacterized protein n=1 Tax=Senna tora TaxID=362788 RepID=A0A834T7C9_9FABA|nr:uncharacterized protein G2W53_029266 [Senna tora]